MNPDTVIPDNTEYDIWHALLRNRLAADIAAKEANGASEADIAPLRQAFDKVLPPRKKEAELAVEALISFSAFEQPGRMRAAVAHAHGLQLDAPELDEKVEALKQTLLADYPALRS